jgi:enoyl-CoA hydratase/carnithine racemase
MQTLHQSHHAHASLDDAGIGRLQLTEAGALNIIGSAAIADLRDALERLAAEPRLRVLVLRGSGERAFIGGADIGEMVTLRTASAEAFISALAGLCDALVEMPVPVIARLAGWCLGGGLEVALACDVRICESGAKFGMPEVKVGIPSVIHAALLPRLIGAARAQWLLLCCENIGAAQAEQWGLVHECVPAPQLDERIEQRAAALAALPPQALRQQKRLLRHWQTVPLAQAVNDSIGEFALAYDSGAPQALMAEFMARKAERAASR